MTKRIAFAFPWLASIIQPDGIRWSRLFHEKDTATRLVRIRADCHPVNTRSPQSIWSNRASLWLLMPRWFAMGIFDCPQDRAEQQAARTCPESAAALHVSGDG